MAVSQNCHFPFEMLDADLWLHTHTADAYEWPLCSCRNFLSSAPAPISDLSDQKDSAWERGNETGFTTTRAQQVSIGLNLDV